MNSPFKVQTRHVALAHAVAVAGAFFIGTRGGAAAVIYSDTFTVSSNVSIAGRVPDVRPGTQTWALNSGTATVNAANDNVAVSASTKASLPVTISDGTKYYLQVTIDPTTGGQTDWLSLGFTNNVATSALPGAGDGNAMAWMLIRNVLNTSVSPNNDVQGFTTGTTTRIVNTDTGSAGAVRTLRVEIDTNGSDRVRMFIDGNDVSGGWQALGYTISGTATHLYIGANAGATGTVDNLSFGTVDARYALALSVSQTKVLLNGKTGVTSTITNTGVTGDDPISFTGLSGTTTLGAISGAGTAGSVTAPAGTQNNVGLTLTAGSTYGTASVTPVASASNGTGSGGVTLTGTTGASVIVGNAVADVDGGFTSGEALSSAVAASETLAGLASRTQATQGSGVLGNVATITNGSNGSVAGLITMNWRVRAPGELSELFSDVVQVDLPGADAGGTYTLRLTYNDGDLGTFNESWLQLGVYQGGQWTKLSGSVVDTSNNFIEVAGLSLDNAQFAVMVPEPASLGVLALGLAGVLIRRRR